MKSPATLILLPIIVFGLLLAGCANPATNVPVNPSSSAPIVGGDRDAHGCIGSAGYSWCEAKQKCLRVWEEKCTDAAQTSSAQLIGGDKDEHGCLGPAGYTWCAAKKKCLRVWEEECIATSSGAEDLSK